MTYDKLDDAICEAAKVGRHPLYYMASREEGERIAEATGRDGFRVIDGRMRSLQRQGKIKYEGRQWRYVEAA
jgi:hypothetical protein